MKIGGLIRKKRRNIDMSQDVLAKLLGTTKGNIWNWEKNRYQPNSERLVRMMQILDISIEELLDSIEHPKD